MDMNDLVGIAAILAVASILIATFFLVNENLKEIHTDNNVYWLDTAITDTVIGNTSNSSLASRLVPYGGDNASLEFFCADSTTGVQVSTGNFTFYNSNSPETPTYVRHNDKSNVTVNCTYNSTNFANQVWQDMNNSESAIGEFNDWTDILIITAMAGLILAIVVGLFAFNASRKVD